MNDIDRPKKLETDSLQDGVLRFCKSREYAQPSDSKPVRNLMAEALKPLAEAILQAQLALKAPGSQKLADMEYQGMRHFAMVHDSFGVHACDIDLLHRVLREEFVRIYSEPVLPNFLREQMKAHPDVPLPALPPPGNLDIRQVLSSPYFFA